MGSDFLFRKTGTWLKRWVRAIRLWSHALVSTPGKYKSPLFLFFFFNQNSWVLCFCFRGSVIHGSVFLFFCCFFLKSSVFVFFFDACVDGNVFFYFFLVFNLSIGLLRRGLLIGSTHLKSSFRSHPLLLLERLNSHFLAVGRIF